MANSIDADLVEILLIEDSPGDARLTAEALKEGKVWNRLSVVGDGETAMQFLHGGGEYTNAPRPDLILLDLNLPGKDGREVLSDIKQDEELKSIPVVVLTTSKGEADVLSSYEAHANAFINKPVDLDEFLDVVMKMEEFWLSIVRLPLRQHHHAVNSGPLSDRT